MKTKSFRGYLEKRLSKKEITEIKKQAALEIKILKNSQKTKKSPAKTAELFFIKFMIYKLQQSSSSFTKSHSCTVDSKDFK